MAQRHLDPTAPGRPTPPSPPAPPDRRRSPAPATRLRRGYLRAPGRATFLARRLRAGTASTARRRGRRGAEHAPADGAPRAAAPHRPPDQRHPAHLPARCSTPAGPSRCAPNWPGCPARWPASTPYAARLDRLLERCTGCRARRCPAQPAARRRVPAGGPPRRGRPDGGPRSTVGAARAGRAAGAPADPGPDPRALRRAPGAGLLPLPRASPTPSPCWPPRCRCAPGRRGPGRPRSCRARRARRAAAGRRRRRAAAGTGRPARTTPRPCPRPRRRPDRRPAGRALAPGPAAAAAAPLRPRGAAARRPADPAAAPAPGQRPGPAPGRRGGRRGRGRRRPAPRGSPRRRRTPWACSTPTSGTRWRRRAFAFQRDLAAGRRRRPREPTPA